MTIIRLIPLMLGVLLTAACETEMQTPSGLDNSAAANGDTFAALADSSSTDTVRLVLSSSTRDVLGLCRISGSETCTSTHSTYQEASKSFEKQGRKILTFAGAVPVSTDRKYVVINSEGGTELTFRLESPDAVISGDPVQGGLSLIRQQTLQEELTYITRDEFKGRLAATPENDQVADWIISHLQKLNIPPARGSDYRQKFRLGVGPTGSQETANIVGLIEGTDPELKKEYIVIGAHMDHAGTLQRGYTCSPGGGGDQICNGADDNGSGTIAVLNVAKALAAVRKSLKRSVIVMWFSGEEEGLIGSKFYVANPVVPLDQTIYMINMDMVGYMKTFGNALAALGGGSSRAGKQILEDIQKKYPDNRIQISDRAGGGSDHAPFFAKGIPGVFFHTGVSNNSNYHRTSDHADKIDFNGMLLAAKVAFETTVRMSQSGQYASYTGHSREPLVSEEELAQTCHHLINNPFLTEITQSLDFTNGNDGRP